MLWWWCEWVDDQSNPIALQFVCHPIVEKTHQSNENKGKSYDQHEWSLQDKKLYCNELFCCNKTLLQRKDFYAHCCNKLGGNRLLQQKICCNSVCCNKIFLLLLKILIFHQYFICCNRLIPSRVLFSLIFITRYYIISPFPSIWHTFPLSFSYSLNPPFYFTKSKSESVEPNDVAINYSNNIFLLQ